MLPSLISAIGLFQQYSTIQPFSDRVPQGICIYSGIISHPSTEKTPAQKIVENAINKVENYFKVPLERSALSNPGTVEGLLDNLKEIGCMIGRFKQIHSYKHLINKI